MPESTTDLAARKCIPCRGDTPPLNEKQIRPLLAELDDWEAVESHHLSKTYRFENFVAALSFVNRLGEVAERENHHPDIYLAWGRVRVDIWTHKINGLTESDFIFAAKADRVLQQAPDAA